MRPDMIDRRRRSVYSKLHESRDLFCCISSALVATRGSLDELDLLEEADVHPPVVLDEPVESEHAEDAPAEVLHLLDRVDSDAARPRRRPRRCPGGCAPPRRSISL